MSGAPWRGRTAISDLESLLVRFERALLAIEQQRHRDAAATTDLRTQQAGDRARLARIEAAASEAVAALDALLAGTA